MINAITATIFLLIAAGYQLFGDKKDVPFWGLLALFNLIAYYGGNL